jgi:hypothetical protein
MSFLTKSLGVLLALAVFAFAAFSLQVNFSASGSTRGVGQARADCRIATNSGDHTRVMPNSS